MDPELCRELTRAVCAVTGKPVWVKMSPEAPDVVAVARACEAAGAEAITAINTIRGMAIDPQTMAVRLANRTGGLSGPAIRPIGVRIVWDLVGALRIPVVGVGGIATPSDALEYLLAGARAVQVGTANFADPTAAHRVAAGIRAYCEERGLSVGQIIGRARPDPDSGSRT
jgi:dihydroorotate dehydrogenase (NAD+) catalytic subunit